MMKVSYVLLAVSALIVFSVANDICELCNCQLISQNNASIIDCKFRRFSEIPSTMEDWPDFTSQQFHYTSVNMDQNNIKKLSQFPALLNVVKLSLKDNQISEIESGAFLNLHSLLSLDLSQNRLTVEGIRPDVLRGQPNNDQYEPLRLQTLDLGYNEIRSLDAKSFEHLPDLCELYLNNNPIYSLDGNTVSALLSLERLKILNLDDTYLSSLNSLLDETTFLKNKVEILYLNGNNFTEVPRLISELGGSLKELHLNRNPISEINDTSFFGLRELRRLSICRMPYLKRIGPATFDHLIHLQVLQCSHNDLLSDIDKDAFRELKTNWPIKEVYFHNNKLSSISKDLLPWSEVEILDLRDNPWNCDCQLSWILTMKRKTSVNNTPYYDTQIHCETPFHLSGVNLLSLSNFKEICPDEKIMSFATPKGLSAHTIVFISSLIFAIFVCIAVICTYFRKRSDTDSRNSALSHLSIIYNKYKLVPS